METLKTICLIWATFLPAFILFMLGTYLVDPENNWLLYEL